MSCESILSNMRYWVAARDNGLDLISQSEDQSSVRVKIDEAEAKMSKLYEQGVFAKCFNRLEGERIPTTNPNSEAYHECRQHFLEGRVKLKPVQSIEGLKEGMICRAILDQMRFWTENYHTLTNPEQHSIKDIGPKIETAKARMSQLYELGVGVQCFHKSERDRLPTDDPNVEAYRLGKHLYQRTKPMKVSHKCR